MQSVKPHPPLLLNSIIVSWVKINLTSNCLVFLRIVYMGNMIYLYLEKSLRMLLRLVKFLGNFWAIQLWRMCSCWLCSLWVFPAFGVSGRNLRWRPLFVDWWFLGSSVCGDPYITPTGTRSATWRLPLLYFVHPRISELIRASSKCKIGDRKPRRNEQEAKTKKNQNPQRP